jgi:hypothetical protein
VERRTRREDTENAEKVRAFDTAMVCLRKQEFADGLGIKVCVLLE